jgi:hypothetical protein
VYELFTHVDVYPYSFSALLYAFIFFLSFVRSFIGGFLCLFFSQTLSLARFLDCLSLTAHGKEGRC